MSQRTSLGGVIRRIRYERDWSLAEMSAVVAIPLSTLAKIERSELSLTYDKLLQLSERLEISLPELFSMPVVTQNPVGTGRRSISGEANTITVASRNYDDNYLCSDLRAKIMTPIIIDVKAADIEEFGSLITHDGEEFIYVVSGSIVVHTDFYGPTEIKAGGGHYLDSQMGHAYVRAPGCDSATILAVCASRSEGLDQALIEQMVGFSEQASGSPPAGKKAKAKSGNRPRSSPSPIRARERSAQR